MGSKSGLKIILFFANEAVLARTIALVLKLLSYFIPYFGFINQINTFYFTDWGKSANIRDFFTLQALESLSKMSLHLNAWKTLCLNFHIFLKNDRRDLMRQVHQIQFKLMFFNLGKLGFTNNVTWKFCIDVSQKKSHPFFPPFSSLFSYNSLKYFSFVSYKTL